MELKQLVKEAVSEEEMVKHAHCFYTKSGILMKKWRPPDLPATEEWQILHQIVLLKKFPKRAYELISWVSYGR